MTKTNDTLKFGAKNIYMHIFRLVNVVRGILRVGISQVLVIFLSST